MTTPYYADDQIILWQGDALETLRTLPDESVNCVVTSPPYYGLRDYGEPGQYGLEKTPGQYVANMVNVFAEARRVLAADGVLWLNLGDCYASKGGAAGRFSATGLEGTHPRSRPEAASPHTFGKWNRDFELPEKNLVGIPWRVAFALQDDGWILRNDVVWNKTNAMPESVRDRLSNRHEYTFLLAKSPRYWFDLDPIREPLSHPEALSQGIVFGGNNGGEGKVGGSARRSGGNRSVYGAGKTGTSGDTPPGTKPQTNRGATGQRHTLTHEAGRNPGDVWSIPTAPFPGAHFAVMPPDIAERCILAGCRPGGVVLDPFAGSGTTGMVASKHGRRFVGIDLSAKYLDLALRTRLAQTALVDEVGGAA